MEHLDADQEKQLELSNQQNVLEVLRDYFMRIQNSIQAEEQTLYPAIYEFWFTSWRNESVRAFFLKRYEKVVSSFTALFLQEIKAGEMSPVMSVDGIAKIRMVNMDGILIHSLAFGTNHIDVSNQVEQLLIV